MADLSLFEMLKDVAGGPDFSEADPPKPWGMESPANNVALAVLQKDLDQRAAAARVLGKGGASPVDYVQTAGAVGKQLLEGAVKTAGAALALPHDVMTGEVDPLSEQGVQRATDLAGLAGGSATSFGRYPVGSLGVFGSRLDPKSKLYQETQAAIDNYPGGIDNPSARPEDILYSTGVSKDINGNWVVEIDDSNAAVKHELSYVPYEEEGVKPEFTLKDIFHHPELYEAFPYLKDVKVTKSMNNSYYGGYSPETNTISLNTNLIREHGEDLKSTILHEIQHAVQDYEMNQGNFKSGGTDPESVMHDTVAGYKVYQKLKEQGKLTDKESALLENLFANARTDYDWYSRNPGEVEARNVQARAHLSKEARREILPRNTEDTPRSEQLDVSIAPTILDVLNAR